MHRSDSIRVTDAAASIVVPSLPLCSAAVSCGELTDRHPSSSTTRARRWSSCSDCSVHTVRSPEHGASLISAIGILRQNEWTAAIRLLQLRVLLSFDQTCARDFLCSLSVCDGSIPVRASDHHAQLTGVLLPPSTAAMSAAAALYDLQHEHSREALAKLPEPKTVFKHLSEHELHAACADDAPAFRG